MYTCALFNLEPCTVQFLMNVSSVLSDYFASAIVFNQQLALIKHMPADSGLKLLKKEGSRQMNVRLSISQELLRDALYTIVNQKVHYS
eukprot:c23724_g1_i1 orf=1117-1380(-)